jgi:hypothetical protein
VPLKLRPAAHLGRPNGTIMVELLDEADNIVAGIYATESGLKIVSKHIVNRPDLVVIDPSYPPAIVVRLL